MKCEVCGYEINDGSVRCSKCGFPVIMMVKGDQQEEEKVRELADTYRKKKLAKVSVALKVYTNEIKDDKVKVKDESYIVLAQGEALSGRAIIWYPEKFARLSGNPELAVSMVNSSGENKTMTLKLKNPQIEDFWQIGVFPEGGFECRLVLGNEEKYEMTELFSVL